MFRTELISVALTLVAAMPVLAVAQQGEPPLSQWQHTPWVGDAAPPPELSGEQMVKSSDGYLWMTASGGLVRFDGVRFTLVKEIGPPELRAGKEGWFHPMFIDRSGTMWVTGPNDLILTYRDGLFRVVSKGFPTRMIGQDRSGRVWAAAEPQGLFTFVDGRRTPLRLPPGVPDSGITSFASDTGNGIWIGTRTNGLWHVVGNTAAHYSTGWAEALLQTRDGTLWANVDAVGPGVRRLVDGKWYEVRAAGMPWIVTYSATEGPDGSVWMPSTQLGVVRWKNGVVERFGSKDGLSSDRVNGVFVDEVGVIWAVTTVGFDRIHRSTFIPVESRHGLPDGLALTPVVPDIDGALWMRTRTSDTVVRLDGGPIRRQPGRIVSTAYPSPRGGFFLLTGPAKAGGVWLAPFQGGLVHQTVYGRSVVEAQGYPGRLGAAWETRDGTIWAITRAGHLGRLRNGRYRQLSLPTIGDTHSLIEDGHGRVWVAVTAMKSLVVFAGDSIVATVPLPGTDFHALALEGGDTLWLAASGALYRIAGDRTVKVPVPALKPLLVPWVDLVVTAGHLWIAGPGGVARAPLSLLHRVADGESLVIQPKIYDALDGIEGGRTPTQASHPIRVAADGRPWVVTQTGLAVADLSVERTNPIGPEVHIENVAVGGVMQTLANGGTISPNPRRVEIRFAAPMPGLAERGRVEYRLDGVDDSWNDGKRTRVAVYNLLSPGRYRFRLRAWNEDGVPSAVEATLGFRVLPAWYQAWWFFALIAAALVSTSGGIVGAVQRRRGQRAARDAEARFDAVLAERTRLAGELHDTLLQAFTGVTLQLQALRGRMLAQPHEAEQDLGRMLKVADVALRDARSAVWDMRAPELEERDVAAALEESAHEAVASHRLGGGGPVDLAVTITGDRRRLPPAVELVAHRIGREAVANALRHADAKHIRVAIAFESRHLCVDVRDDGVGFDSSQLRPTEGQGHWGLVGMAERARNARGTLDIRSAAGSGTAVQLRVPVDSA